MTKLVRSSILVALLLALPAANAAAQAWEISPFARYVTSAKFDNLSYVVGLEPASELIAGDAFTYGAGIGYVPNSQFMFEVEYAYQGSDLILRRPAQSDANLTNLNIHKIRGNFLFSAPGSGEDTQPYFLVGLGDAIFDTDFGSKSKFSWQLGAGVKKMTSETVGFRLQAAYAPSYLNTDDAGYWCDPFYGCYTVPDPQYLDQWEFSLNIVKRFGEIYR